MLPSHGNCRPYDEQLRNRSEASPSSVGGGRKVDRSELVAGGSTRELVYITGFCQAVTGADVPREP